MSPAIKRMRAASKKLRRETVTTATRLKPNDIIGKKFGRLTVIYRAGKRTPSGYKFGCKCECGKQKAVLRISLVRGHTRSCGCLRRETASSRQSKSIVGERFYRLVALNAVDTNRKGSNVWLCLCDCGRVVEVRTSSLISGNTKSCGCINRKKIIDRNKARTTHGGADAREYQTWRGVIRRCTDPKCEYFHRYGGRGIKVCDRWLGKNGFQNFMSDMGVKPANCSIERIDNDGNYEPSNCRWATSKEQGNNHSRNRIIEFNGESKTMSQWANACGLTGNALLARLRRGWSVEKALTTPVGNANKTR